MDFEFNARDNFTFGVREYDKYINRKYKEALASGATTAPSELDFWEEITRPKEDLCIRPILNCNGEPIQYDGSIVEFSR